MFKPQVSEDELASWNFPIRVLLLPGLLALSLAVPGAIFIHFANQSFSGNSYISTGIIWIGFFILLAVPSAAYLLAQRRFARPDTLGLILLATLSVLLVSVYFYWAGRHIVFPADFLIWAESEFVNDITKFRLGYPIFSAEVNNESYHYPPGTQLLTYFISIILGNGTSLTLYRSIQAGFTLLAAIVAFFSALSLVRFRFPNHNYRTISIWGIIWLSLLYLIATNAITNPFVHLIHNDGLSLLVTSIAYFLLVRYAMTRDKRVLALMAIIPAVGFLVKQNAAVWAGLYVVYLLFFDQPRSISRLVIFAAAAFGGLIAVAAAGYAIWGEPFIYWIFIVAGSIKVSLLRSFQHILDVWPYFALGLIGGFVLLRGQEFKTLFGLWVVWLLLILAGAYTSGNAFMVHHMGPGSLIGGIWFVAALPEIWNSGLSKVASGFTSSYRWLAYSIAVALAVLFFNGLGIIRIPLNPVSDEALRYVKDIESEFEEDQIENTLLDSGSWVYLKNDVLMKDRVTSIGNRGSGQTGDFSGIIQRIEQKRYSKILVRGLHSPDFWYDNTIWRESSGIREALLNNYHEVKSIDGLEGDDRYLFRDISVLRPNTGTAALSGK